MTPHEAVPSHRPVDDGSTSDASSWRLTRREVVKAGAALSASGVVGVVHAQAGGSPTMAAAASPAPAAGDSLAPQMMPLTLSINGQPRQLTVDTRTTLLDALRENLQLTGSKKGCDHGQCGACTVLIDGRRTNACLTLAVMHDGQAITTIEGLSTGPAGQEKLHPIQEAFLKHDGFQCGYCTPGQICSTAGMLNEVKMGMPSHVTRDLTRSVTLDEAEIRERMSGNLCRCSAYPNIVAAIKEVSGART